MDLTLDLFDAPSATAAAPPRKGDNTGINDTAEWVRRAVYPGNRLDNLPPGQKSTWHQWCRNAGHNSDDRSGAAWEAYLSGMTGGTYRKELEKKEKATA